MTARPSRGAGSSGPARRRAAARLLGLACVPLLVAGLAGCSFSVGGSNLDTEKLEREITKGIKDQLNIDATVSCPREVKIAKGESFQCVATDADGETAPVVVNQKDDSGNVSWKLGTDTTPTDDTPTGTTTTP